MRGGTFTDAARSRLDRNRAEQRVKEIERIIREEPRRYWRSEILQRELRENLAAMHGGEYDLHADGDVFAIGPNTASPDAADASGTSLGPAKDVL
jgi:hypothetical protein